MNKISRVKQLSAIFALMFFSSVSLGQDTQPTRSGKQTTLVTINAMVEAINHETREATLAGPLGNSVSFVVDQRVQRLDEINVGDTVVAEYYISIAGELREPTPLERETPLVVLEGAGITPDGATPAGGVLRAFQVVAVVIGLDLPTQSVNLLGPRGNTGTIVVQVLDNLRALRLGDTVILTYTEALAISLEKVE